MDNTEHERELEKWTSRAMRTYLFGAEYVAAIDRKEIAHLLERAGRGPIDTKPPISIKLGGD